MPPPSRPSGAGTAAPQPLDRSARAVALQPEWLPHSFSADGQQIASVFVPRGEHDKLTFLNDHYFANRFAVALHDRAEVEAIAAAAPECPLHFIFHTGFCCSTLLAKALTVPGRSIGLKEPVVLNDLALHGAESDRLRLTLRLLARPFDQGGTVIAKASNVANKLVAPVLDSSPASRAILLSSDLRSTLLAVAKQGLDRRIWVRQLYLALSKWTSIGIAGGLPDAAELPDLPLAALAWFMQVEHFRHIARRYGSNRVQLLDGAALLARPAETLAKVSSFLDLDFDRATISAIVDGPAFHTHSKRIGAPYDSSVRDSELSAARRSHGPEIHATIRWLERVTRGAVAA